MQKKRSTDEEKIVAEPIVEETLVERSANK